MTVFSTDTMGVAVHRPRAVLGRVLEQLVKCRRVTVLLVTLQ